MNQRPWPTGSVLLLSLSTLSRDRLRLGWSIVLYFGSFFFPKAKPYKIKTENSSELLKLKSQSPRLNDIQNDT